MSFSDDNGMGDGVARDDEAPLDDDDLSASRERQLNPRRALPSAILLTDEEGPAMVTRGLDPDAVDQPGTPAASKASAVVESWTLFFPLAVVLRMRLSHREPDRLMVDGAGAGVSEGSSMIGASVKETILQAGEVGLNELVDSGGGCPAVDTRGNGGFVIAVVGAEADDGRMDGESLRPKNRVFEGATVKLLLLTTMAEERSSMGEAVDDLGTQSILVSGRGNVLSGWW